MLLLCPLFFPKVLGEDNTKIVILKNDGITTKPIHRLPSKVPMECFYYSSSNSVLITFSSQIGDVDVDIYNMSTGEQVGMTILSQNISFVPCPGIEGYCIITFRLSNGNTYYGEFEL